MRAIERLATSTASARRSRSSASSGSETSEGALRTISLARFCRSTCARVKKAADALPVACALPPQKKRKIKKWERAPSCLRARIEEERKLTRKAQVYRPLLCLLARASGEARAQE